MPTIDTAMLLVIQALELTFFDIDVPFIICTEYNSQKYYYREDGRFYAEFLEPNGDYRIIEVPFIKSYHNFLINNGQYISLEQPIISQPSFQVEDICFSYSVDEEYYNRLSKLYKLSEILNAELEQLKQLSLVSDFSNEENLGSALKFAKNEIQLKSELKQLKDLSLVSDFFNEENLGLALKNIQKGLEKKAELEQLKDLSLVSGFSNEGKLHLALKFVKNEIQLNTELKQLKDLSLVPDFSNEENLDLTLKNIQKGLEKKAELEQLSLVSDFSNEENLGSNLNFAKNEIQLKADLKQLQDLRLVSDFSGEGKLDAALKNIQKRLEKIVDLKQLQALRLVSDFSNEENLILNLVSVEEGIEETVNFKQPESLTLTPNSFNEENLISNLKGMEQVIEKKIKINEYLDSRDTENQDLKFFHDNKELDAELEQLRELHLVSRVSPEFIKAANACLETKTVRMRSEVFFAKSEKLGLSKVKLIDGIIPILEQGPEGIDTSFYTANPELIDLREQLNKTTNAYETHEITHYQRSVRAAAELDTLVNKQFDVMAERLPLKEELLRKKINMPEGISPVYSHVFPQLAESEIRVASYLCEEDAVRIRRPQEVDEISNISEIVSIPSVSEIVSTPPVSEIVSTPQLFEILDTPASEPTTRIRITMTPDQLEAFMDEMLNTFSPVDEENQGFRFDFNDD